MAMPSVGRQFSNEIASKPAPKRESSKAPNTNELERNVTKLIQEFEELHVQGLSLTNKKVVAIRHNLEKEMPHLYQLTYRIGPPYASKRIQQLKDMAENCLRPFNVDLDALRPKIVNVTKSISALAITNAESSPFSSTTTGNVNFHSAQMPSNFARTDFVNSGVANINGTAVDISTNNTNINNNNTLNNGLPPRIPTSHIPSGRGILDLSTQQQQQLHQTQGISRGIQQSTLIKPYPDAPSGQNTNNLNSLSAGQKSLFCAVHEVVDKINSHCWLDDSSNENNPNQNNPNTNCSRWMEAPAALTPDEFKSFDLNVGLGTDNMNAGANNQLVRGATIGTNGGGIMGGGMSITDGRVAMNNAFGSLVQPAYNIQSIQGGHMGGINNAFHQHVNREQ